MMLGCAALIIRLPFSIVQPHLVSVGVLGSLLRRDADALKRSVVLFVIAGTIDAVLDFWCVFVFSFTKARIIRDLRNRLFSSILRQEAAFFDSARTGDILSRLTSDTVEIANDLTWVFRFSIEAVVRITGVAGYMFLISPPLAGAACLAVPLVALGNKFYGQWLHDNAKRVQAALAASNAHATEIVSAAHTVISFAAEYFEAQRYAGFIQTLYTFSMWQVLLRSRGSPPFPSPHLPYLL
jgi:ATP-binding cassette subfamily B (MDR/TAP) protein 9